MMGLEPHQIENIALTFLTGLLVIVLALLGFELWSFLGFMLMATRW